MGRGYLRAAILCGFVAAACAPSQTLVLGPTPGWDSTGGILSVDVTLQSQGGAPPAAIQWTLGFPVMEIDQVTAGPKASSAGKSLQCSGKYTLAHCVVAGGNANAIADGVIATVRLRALSLTAGTAPVMLSGITAASAAGDGLALHGDGTAIQLSAPPAAPLPPGTTLTTGSMAQVVAGGIWKTTITLINTGSEAAVAQLDFFDNQGQPLVLPIRYPQDPVDAVPMSATALSQTVRAGAVAVVETAAANAPDFVEGWARLTTPGSVEGFVIFAHTGTHQEAAVPLRMLDSLPQVLAFDNTSGRRSGLALANLATRQTSVVTVIRDDQGNMLDASTTIQLGPLGHASFMLDDFFSITAGKRGTLEFQAGGGTPLSAIGLRANGSSITTLPLLTSSSAASTSAVNSIAHVASGDGWTTSFTLVNRTGTNQTAALNFHAQAGSPLPLTLQYPQAGMTLSGVFSTSDSIAPGASLWIETGQQAAAPGEGESSQVTVGSATLTGDVRGFAVFRSSVAGQEAVIPLEARNAAALWLPYDNTNGVATGFALTDAAGIGGPVGLTFRDESGELLGTAGFRLDPHGQASFILADRFGVTGRRRGTIAASPPPGGQISMIGIRATPEGTFTTLPVLEGRQ